MDSFLSSAAGSTTSLFRSDLMIPRVRARPTTGTSSSVSSSTTTTVMDDAPRSSSVTSAPRSSTSSSSSSSATTRRRALGSGLSGVAASFAAGEDFSQQARASTSSTASDSAHAAARLREITRRVGSPSAGGAGPSSSMRTARSVSPELYAFDTASEAGTLLPSHPPHTDSRHVPIPSDLESDLDSMAANAYKPHASRSRAVPGPERLKALVDTLTSSEDVDERPATPPRIRVRTLSFPEGSPQPVRMNGNLPRVSLSDEEAEAKTARYSSASQRSRRDRSATPSLDVLRAQLESPSMSGRELNDTPARPLRNASHPNPLYAEIESVDFESELPNPTPHHSFVKSAPIRTSTPRSSSQAHNRSGSVVSDQSSVMISPFRPPGSARPSLGSSLRPESPSDKKRAPSPMLGERVQVGRRKRVSLAYNRTTQEDVEDDAETVNGDGKEALRASSSSRSSSTVSGKNQSQSQSRLVDGDLPSGSQSLSFSASGAGTTTRTVRQDRTTRNSPSPKLGETSVTTSFRSARNSPSPLLANTSTNSARSGRDTSTPSVSYADARSNVGASTSRSFTSSAVYQSMQQGDVDTDGAGMTETEAEAETEAESVAPPPPSTANRSQSISHSNASFSFRAQPAPTAVDAERNKPKPIPDRSASISTTAPRNESPFASGSFRAEYDSFLESQKKARLQEREARESTPQPPAGTSAAMRSAMESAALTLSNSPKKNRPPPSARPSTPPPSSPDRDGSPGKNRQWSNERDLERLRKGANTATTSPRKDRSKSAFVPTSSSSSAEEELEEDGDGSVSGKTHAPTLSSRESTPTRSSPPKPSIATKKSMTSFSRVSDDELDEPSRISLSNSRSSAMMLFKTPPRPRSGAKHTRNNKSPPRPDDLPDLPTSPPDSSDSPFVVRSSNASTPIATKNKGKEKEKDKDQAKGKGRLGSFDQAWQFPNNATSPVGTPIKEGDETDQLHDADESNVGSANTTPVPEWVGSFSHPKTPKPPGGWESTPVAANGSKKLVIDPQTPVGQILGNQANGDTEGDSSLPDATFANIRTPAPPGSWAARSQQQASTPASSSLPTSTSDPTGNLSLLKTPAPPGSWNTQSSSAPPSGPNSLRKGILKVRFDDTSLASWNELQRMSGDADAKEVSGDWSPGKVRKPLPAPFGAEDTGTTRSPAGTMRKRKSRLRMVDEFGNALPEPPGTSEDEDEAEVANVEVKEEAVDPDDGPASMDEIRGLRRVARAVPLIAKEMSDESMSISTPAPLVSLTDQAKSESKIAELHELSRTSRVQRGKIQRRLQLARNAEHDDGTETKLALLREALDGTAPDATPARVRRDRRCGPWSIILFLALQVLVFCFFFQWAASRADRMFLSTHFDPFFPAIYSPSPPLAPPPSSHSARLWDLLKLDTLTGARAPPPPPPPSHVFFHLIPRSSMHPMVLKLMDRTINLLSSPFPFSVLDALEDARRGGDGALVPS